MQKLTLTPALFEKVRRLLGETAGLQFDETKLNTLQSHLRDRVRAIHCNSLDEYYDLIADPGKGREELRKLLESVTIHETSFFRNHEHYRALRELVLPDLARRKAGDRRLHIWSAGCSTGEEPYSLAITCLEHPMLVGWEIKIEASDLSERVLTFARRGTYRTGALRYLEPDRIRHWFKRQIDDPIAHPVRRGTGPLDPLVGQREVFAISEKVRALVTFHQMNLASWPYPTIYNNCDLIFCENVIIYFRPDMTRAVVAQFYNCLNPGAYLFLGYSETLWQISDRYQLITHPNTFFYQRPLTEGATAPAKRSPSAAAIDIQEMLRRLNQAAPAHEPSRSGEAHRAPLPRDGDAAASSTRPLPSRSPARPAPPAAPPAPANGDTDPALAIAIAEQLTKEAHKHLEAGRYPEAQATFAEALSRNTASVDALVGLAQIHANQGRLAEAQTECQKALDIDVLCEEAHLLSAL